MVHEQFPDQRRFAWQTGYAAFTVSGPRSDAVKDYMAGQPEHHRRVSFKEEFLKLLEKIGIANDARDVWGALSVAISLPRLTPWAIVFGPSG